MTASKFSVFELVNERLKQIFVSATDSPIFAVASRLRKSPPAVITDWKEADMTMLRSIEFGLTREEAAKFIEGYVRSRLPPGWSFVREIDQF